MSRSLGRELPTEVATGLARPSEARDQALILATVDEGLCPRLALLSLAEIVVVDPCRLLVAPWASSNSTATFNARTEATLFWSGHGTGSSILLQREETVPLSGGGRPLVAVATLVKEVRGDEVGYATLTNAITFELADPSDVLPKWQNLGRPSGPSRRQATSAGLA